MFRVSIYRFLLEAGFDVSRQTVHGTCLHEAVLHGQIKAVKFLLDVGHLNLPLLLACRIYSGAT